MMLFGKRKTPQEQLRENQRCLNRTMRELDRERVRLESEQTKLTNDLTKMARQNQMDAVKIIAKDIVRSRTYVKKIIMMRTNIQAVSMKMQTLKSTASMTDAMKQVTRTISRMNKQMELPQLQKILMEFEKQSEIMDMKEEVISDAMDSAFAEDNDLEDTNALVQRVLDELGIDMSKDLRHAPTNVGAIGLSASGNKASGAPVAVTDGSDEPVTVDEDDLEARLQRLKRG